MIDVDLLRHEIKQVNQERRRRRKDIDNRKLWNAEWSRLHSELAFKNPTAFTEAWKRFYENEFRFTAERATKLYALMAQIKGNQHMFKRYVPANDTMGTLKVEFTPPEWLVGFTSDVAAEFEVPEVRKKVGGIWYRYGHTMDGNRACLTRTIDSDQKE